MILYHYTDIDELQHILSVGKQGTPCAKLKFKHRSNVNDDPYNLFSLYVLPRCVEKIEKELGVEERDSLLPLLRNRSFMEAVFRENKSFDDRSSGLSQFVISFFEDIDNLDLWLRYGVGGKGVSIGLDTEKLKHPFGQVFNFLFRECVYWPKEITNPAFEMVIPEALYDEIKEMYHSTTNIKVVEAFQKLYACDTPEFAVTQRIKETLVHHLINTFDMFHKCDDWKGEKEHRLITSVMSHEINYEKNVTGDYDPYVEVEFPVEALKIIMLGPKCGKNAYGMIQSLIFSRQIKEKIQVLNSHCMM